MGNILRLENISDYNKLLGQETLHPLVSVIDFSKCKPVNHGSLNFGFYGIFLKDVKCGDIKYGREYYDYQEGTLVFFGPNQVVSLENRGEYFQPKGHALIFHPDIMHGTSLGREIDNYTFFSYETNEALHLSEKERNIIIECLSKITYEMEQGIDKHSKKLIVNNIELLLNYCVRFYGFPHVSYFADKLNLSANYFGDLVKKETGKSAQECIQIKLINVAKERIFDSRKTINEIAFELGFKYPQHFTRMFKKNTGYSPNEFRLMN